jgi:penicillin-binding protein 1B
MPPDESGRKRGARKGAAKSTRKKAARKRAASSTAGAKQGARAEGRARGGERRGAPRRGGTEARRRRARLVRNVRRVGFCAAIGDFVLGLWVATWLVGLDREVVARFEGRRFDVPSKVVAAPMVVYPGMDWQRVDLAGWLRRLGYREQPSGGSLAPGRYQWSPGQLRVNLRAFAHPTSSEPAREVVFFLAGGVIQEIVDLADDSFVDVVVLEPEPVSAFLGSEREQRDLVQLDEVPRHLVNAIFAVEDRRFEQHHGIDVRRIGGAALANLKAGRITQGGSTLTQQLVKNFFLTPERTLTRKLREAAMSLIVEARYDKDAILEAYLNEIYLGRRGSTAVHGVGEAARLYFGKQAADLTLAESALIAAIIQSPNGISPHRHPERATARRDLVLGLMGDLGYASEAEVEAARAEPLRVASVTEEEGEVRYFLAALAQQLPEVYDEEALTSEGLRIYTTLEPRMQRAAARALKAGLARIEGEVPEDTPADARLQGCLIAMRPQTGEILALVGGRDFGVSQFNRCTQARRQVGSVFKPIVYVTALDPATGPRITLASRIDDSPFELETRTGPWRPENWDDEFHGDAVPVREALERSMNVASARLADDVGIGRVAAMAERLGITSPLPRVPSLALGTAEVSPVEVARAYATLANGGRRPVPRTFVDVVQASGEGVEHRPLEGAERAIDPGLAFLGTSLLEGVVDRGTAVGVRRAGLEGPIAGKTGTTDDEFDLWFVGYTPELVAVVWVGYDEPKSVGVASSRGALTIRTDFMIEVTGTHVRGAFPRPANIEETLVEPSTGALALAGCREAEREWFLAGTLPEQTCPPGGARPEDQRPGILRRTFGRLFGSGR